MLFFVFIFYTSIVVAFCSLWYITVCGMWLHGVHSNSTRYFRISFEFHFNHQSCTPSTISIPADAFRRIARKRVNQPLLFFGPTRDACTPLSTHKILRKSYAQKFTQSRWTCPLDHLLKYVHVPFCFCRLRFSPKCDPYYSQNQSQSSKEKERKE